MPTEKDIEAREAAESRQWITRAVIWTWIASLCAYVLTELGASVVPAAAKVPQDVLELIKIAVLPLTTLVLGYYLSRAK